jgi:hypothetical protein
MNPVISRRHRRLHCRRGGACGRPSARPRQARRSRPARCARWRCRRPARSAALPDVPTVAEAGVPKYSFDAWIALIGPGGLPKAVVDSDYAALKAALASPEAQAAFAAQGLTLLDTGPDLAPAFFPGGAGEAPEAGEAVGGDAGLRPRWPRPTLRTCTAQSPAHCAAPRTCPNTTSPTSRRCTSGRTGSAHSASATACR